MRTLINLLYRAILYMKILFENIYRNCNVLHVTRIISLIYLIYTSTLPFLEGLMTNGEDKK